MNDISEFYDDLPDWILGDIKNCAFAIEYGSKSHPDFPGEFRAAVDLVVIRQTTKEEWRHHMISNTVFYSGDKAMEFATMWCNTMSAILQENGIIKGSWTINPN